MRRASLFSTLLLLLPAGLFASVDSDLLALVPASAKTVAAVDVSRAQSSPFGQYLLANPNGNASHLDEFAAKSGFDPRHDLTDLLVLSFGPDNASPGRFAVLARGAFDIDKINTYASAHGSVSRPYDSWTISVQSSKDKRSTAFVFPQADVAIFGDLPTVKAILDNSSSPGVIDPQLRSLINSVGPKNDAWFASIVPGDSFSHLNLPNQPFASQAQVLQSVRQSSGGVHFGSAVDVSFSALTRSPQDATALANVIRFGVSFVQMQGDKDQNAAILASALDKMNLSTSGSTTQLSFGLTESDLEQLAQNHRPASVR